MVWNVKDIPTSELGLNDIPNGHAKWTTVGRFALTFDGYAWAGSEEKCREFTERTRQKWDTDRASLRLASCDEARACLFYEQRNIRNRDMGSYTEFGPTRSDWKYIRALVDRIREDARGRLVNGTNLD